MKFEEVMLNARKVGEYFQRLQVLDKLVVVGVFVLVSLTVLSTFRAEVVFIFVAALYGGGWAGTLVTGNDRVFNSRKLLPFLPDLVGCLKEKRKHAGLSILPNFGEDLGEYSVNSHDGRRFSISKKKQGQNAKGYHSDPLSFTVPYTVDEEFQQLIKSVMHDFVLSWYSIYVSDHSQVSEDLLEILLSTSQNLSFRLAVISKRNLFTNVLVEFRTHVHRFQRARSSLRRLCSGRAIDSSSLVASYEMFSLMHPAIEDTATETDYMRSIMRVLLYSAVPKTVTQCQASTTIIAEILTCNVLLPLLNLLADPDFLYRLIVLIISSAVMSSSGKAEALGRESADKLVGKKPTYAGKLGQRGLLQENVNISDSDMPRLPINCLDASASSEGSDNQCLKRHPKSTTVNKTFEPRSEPKIQSDQSHADPSYQLNTEIPAQLTLKDHSLLLPSTETSILSSSRVPVSRSVDALFVNSQSALSHGNQSLGNLPPSCSLSNSGCRRSASDSSLNPALGSFIPGDVNHFEVPSTCLPGDTSPVAGPSARLSMPRPPTEGAEHTAEKLVIPFTALEPAMTQAPFGADSNNGTCRQRRFSAESFSSIDFESSQLNMPFSDIDYQFTTEGGPRGHRAASIDSFVASDESQMKRSKSVNAIGKEIVQNGQYKENSVSNTRNLVPDGVSYREGKFRSTVHVSQPVGTVDVTLVGHQVTSGINVKNSPIKMLLRRVSFSKKKHLGSQIFENTGAINLPVSTSQQSAPISIPVSAEVPTPVPSSMEENRSPPLLTEFIPTISAIDGTQIPTAENPRIISISAPETSESESISGITDRLVQLKVINLSIPTAEVCKDMGGKGEFFLYSMQFDVLPTSSPSSSTENLQRCGAEPVHKTAKRRHREFVNLHSRLEHNPRLKYSLKGIRDVPKRLSIPLAPTAKSAIDQRRISHQRYLQQLLARPLLHTSAELAEFLGLEGNTNIEYVRHQLRDYVPRIDKILRHRVLDLVDTIKHVKSAIPRALSDIGPLPPMSPPMSPIRKSRPSQEVGKKILSPPGSPRPGSPSSIGEHDSNGEERIFAFDRRPKTTWQLAMGSIIQDHTCETVASSTSSGYPTSATSPTNHYCLGPRSEGDGCESFDAMVSEKQSDGRESRPALGSEEVSLFDSVLCLLGEAFHDKELWFLDEGFQSALTVLAGGLFDGWIERQVNLLLSEHWCAFYLAELREVLWPDGKLLSGSEGKSIRTEADKEATRKEALAMLVDLMPESFYKLVGRQDWQDGLELLLDSLGDPQLNRHLVFTALDLFMDALIPEIKDESFQRDLLSSI